METLELMKYIEQNLKYVGKASEPDGIPLEVIKRCY